MLNRRRFLNRTVLAGLATMAGASLGVPWFVRRAMAAGAIPGGTKKILFIFLRGGNDGLNTVIPWADDAYNPENRPTLFIPPPDPQSSQPGRMTVAGEGALAMDLGNGFAGVHPGLADIAPLFNDGQLALIHRVGYPKQSRSHFDSQKYWENGVPRDDFQSSGIFYRAVVETGLHEGRQFPAVSVQSSTPMILRGPIAMTNLSDPDRYDMQGTGGRGADREKLLQAITAQHGVPYPQKANRDLLFATGRALKDSIEALKGIGIEGNDFFDADGTTHLFPIDSGSNQKGFSSGSYGFFEDLKVASQVLAFTDAVVAGTRLDGFDTHDNQGGVTGGHSNRMQYLGWALYAVRQFFEGVNPQLWKDTVVVTLSEFGRTSKENGNRGTDHAEAGVMFVAGGGIKGGVYQCDNGSWPTGPKGAMFQVNSRYLRRSVDYRSVLGEVIRDHLGATGAQLKAIIPGYADPRENIENGGISPDGTPIVGELGLA